MTIRPITSLGDVTTLTAAMRLSPATYNGDIIEFYEADYGDAPLNFSGITCGSKVTIRPAATAEPTVPGFDLHGSTWLWVEDFPDMYLSWDTTGRYVINADDTDHCGVVRSHFDSDPFEDMDYTGYVAVTVQSGVFQNGEVVRTYSDLVGAQTQDPAKSKGGTGYVRLDKPRSSLVGAAGNFAICGDDPGTTCKGTTGGSNSAGGQAYVPLSTTNKWQAGYYIRGDDSDAIALLGNETSNLTWNIAINASPTGAFNFTAEDNVIRNLKWGINARGQNISWQRNDVRDFYTSPANFGLQISGLINKNNKYSGGWSRHEDGEVSGTGGPHSSMGGYSTEGEDIDGVVHEDNDGTVGLRRFNVLGSYALASGTKINDNEGRWTNCSYKRNREISTDGIGLETDRFGAGCEVYNNMNIRLPDMVVGLSAVMYVQLNEAGAKYCKNIAGGFDIKSTNAAEVFQQSFDNMDISVDVTTGPQSLQANFDGIGGVFTNLTVDDFDVAFNPKVNGRVALGQYGASFDFNGTKPVTSVPTGVDMDRVRFEGQYTRYTKAPDATLFSSPTNTTDVFSFTIGLIFLNNASVYLQGLPTGYSVRRLNTGKVRVSGTGFQVDSSFTCLLGEFVVLTFEAKLSTYYFRLMKGAYLDPFPSVSTWTGAALSMTQASFTFMASGTGASPASADVAFFRWKNALLNLDDPDVHDRLVALDGYPCDHGTNGALLWGSPADVSLEGDALAWNAALGLNLGAATRKFIVSAPTLTTVHEAEEGPPDPPDPPAGQTTAILFGVPGFL